MAELAAEAGVTRPILYDHFGDRAGVAAGLVARFGGDLDKALASAFAKPVTLREAVVEGIEFFCRFVEAEPEVFRFLQAAASRPEEVVSMESAIGNRLGDVLSSALRSSGGDPRMGPTWGYAILGMVFASAEWWSQRSTPSSRQVTRRALVVHLETLISGALEAAGIADATGPL